MAPGAAAGFDGAKEPNNQKIERVAWKWLPQRARLARGHDLSPQGRVVGFGHAEQVGDDRQRERLGVLGYELTLPVLDELVDQGVGGTPHELLVLLQAFRGQQ